jgi:mannose-6-phosphate isomerase
LVLFFFDPKSMNARWHSVIALALIALLASALYAPFLGNPRVFDDRVFFLGQNFAKYATTPFGLDIRLPGYFTLAFVEVLWPRIEAHRILSLVFHAACAWALYRLLRRLLGEVSPHENRFPLLTKFLFPRDKLSVQVHPDDEGARRIGQPCGKTECWYVLHSEPGAQVGLGLKPGTTKAEVEQAIHQTRMEQLLNWIEIRQGDMIYVDAGTVHAIGPGAVIVETQQNSDTTYRLYDYGRPRELHIEHGLAATRERTHAGKVTPGAHNASAGKVQVNLITSPCFIVDSFTLTQPWRFQRPRHARRSVWCLVATRGCGVIESAAASPVTFSADEAMVIPAALDEFVLRPQWEVEFLCASVPVEQVAHPRTTLLETAANSTT